MRRDCNDSRMKRLSNSKCCLPCSLCPLPLFELKIYVEILTDSDGVKKGHLLSLDYVASTKLAADAVILADYEGDDAG